MMDGGGVEVGEHISYLYLFTISCTKIIKKFIIKGKIGTAGQTMTCGKAHLFKVNAPRGADYKH